MKILTRKQFMNMPVGTVFSYYEPHCFHELNIKASDLSQGWEVDFLFDPIIGAVKNNSSEDFTDKCEQMEKGSSVEMDFEFTAREGLFEDKQLFAVYEREDVKKLINRLEIAYNGNETAF